MTQYVSDGAGTLCVLCGQAPGDPSPVDRSADSGPMLLAVHSDGTACGYAAHDICVRYVRAHGPLADVDCPCGRGEVVEGVPRPLSWQTETRTDRGRTAEHASDDGVELPTEREADEEDDDSDGEDA
jgi:hypothetical protein